LRRLGIERAQRFSWAQSAQIVRRTYERVLSRTKSRPAAVRPRSRIAALAKLTSSPGEPAGGPADLIFALEERCDVDVFAIDRVSRVEGLGPHTRVFSSCHFERLMRREEYAAVVYEIDVDQAWVIPL